jgi:recombination protein RecA
VIRGVARLNEASPVAPGVASGGHGTTPGATPVGAPGAMRPAWSLGTVGARLVELSGQGAAPRLSLAFALVRDAQRRGETAAWVTHRDGTFYPPDAAAGGVRLDHLPVVFAPDAPAAARAADKLVRSGAFGLVVLDLGVAMAGSVPVPLLSRLSGLARQHEAAVVFLTDKPSTDPSLGPLVSLRCEGTRQAAAGGRFACVVRAIKDKRRGPGWSSSEVRRGPVGLR